MERFKHRDTYVGCCTYRMIPYKIHSGRTKTILLTYMVKILQVTRRRLGSCLYRGGGRLYSIITVSIIITLLFLQGIHISNIDTAKRSNVVAHRHPNPAHCRHVHLAVPSSGHQQRQRLPILIKSILLYSRDSILHLHILSSKQNKHSTEVLLKTWNLPHVVPHYYIDDGHVDDLRSLVELTGYFIRNRHLLNGVEKLILVQPEVCFVNDVAILWDQLPTLVSNTMMAAVESSAMNSIEWLYNGVMLLNLDQIPPILSKLEPICVNASLAVTMDRMATRDIRALVSVMCRGSSGDWEVGFDRQIYEIPTIQTESLPLLYVGNISLSHPMHDRIIHAEHMDGDLFRLMTPQCIQMEHQRMTFSDPCEMFPYIATTKRRTHPYFAGNQIPSLSGSKPEVTLITQLMLNRIHHLERLLSAWKGPSHVTLYMNDEEAVTFADVYRRSVVLQSANASFHVVYKRHKYYPINYARNVAIREVTTPYYVMVDVDFAAQPSLYGSIQNHIKTLKPQEKKVFVIPVFETLIQKYQIPSTKKQLLADIDQKKVFPYHQLDGVWTRGHRMTDYDQWRKSSQTYQIPWEFGFEPYVVVPTAEFKYDETLVERMRDKLTYTVEIMFKGYSMHVLPFDYLIHTPHEKSDSHVLSDRAFQACAAVLYERSIDQLKKKYGQHVSATLLEMLEH